MINRLREKPECFQFSTAARAYSSSELLDGVNFSQNCHHMYILPQLVFYWGEGGIRGKEKVVFCYMISRTDIS
jgi:hypothetical protein